MNSADCMMHKNVLRYVLHALRYYTKDITIKTRFKNLTEPKHAYFGYAKKVVEKDSEEYFIDITPRIHIRYDDILRKSCSWSEFVGKFLDKYKHLCYLVTVIFDDIDVYNMSLYVFLHQFASVSHKFKLTNEHIYNMHACQHVYFVREAFLTSLLTKQPTAIQRFRKNKYFDKNLIRLILEHITYEDIVILR